MQNNNFQQKVSLVTGGLQGIGNAIAKTLQKRGDHIYIFDYIEKNDDRVKSLQEQGFEYVRVDVSSVESIENGFAQLPERIDVVVNNAGITKDGLAVRLKEPDWDHVLNVNLKGSFFIAQHAIKRMMRNKIAQPADARGYIINMSSIVALSGNPGQVNYVASKAGLCGVTKTLAHEYAGKNILVNAIAPGFIQTPMTDKLPERVKDIALSRIALKRFGTSEDVANLIAFLSSGSADYITGQTIEVTGGMQ